MEETPISAGTVTAVAADTDVSEATLRESLVALQSLASDSPGVETVDDLVYEWRRAFREDPLVERTAEAYYLVVPARVWADFADRLGWDDAERRAVEAAHAASMGDCDGGVPLVLCR
ncbi:MAG: hypothetical protein ABEJ80_00120 [Halarchaeum sp.]